MTKTIKKGSQIENTISEDPSVTSTTLGNVIQGIGGLGYRALGAVFPRTKSTNMNTDKPTNVNPDGCKEDDHVYNNSLSKLNSPTMEVTPPILINRNSFETIADASENDLSINDLDKETNPLIKKVQ